MDLKLAGKSVVVTGGGSNIGRSIALLFAKEGAKTAILDIDLKAAQQTVALAKPGAGGACAAVQVDVSSLESVQKALGEVEKAHGPVDVFVSGVGWNFDKYFLDQSRAEMEKVVQLNLWGTINCVNAVLPGMVERQKGSIITIASDAGRVGEFREAVYSACKAGGIAFMKALAKEYGPKGIRFNAVCPGVTVPPDAEMTDNSMWAGENGMRAKIFTPEIEKRVAKTYPLRRVGTGDDIAGAVVFLGSDAASFVTGQTLSVSGGYSMM